MSEIGYYKEQLPKLIEKLKSMVTKNLDLIDADITGDLTEDKNHAVLKGRRMAAEDCDWAMQKIEELEAKLSGTIVTAPIGNQSWSKRTAVEKTG